MTALASRIKSTVPVEAYFNPDIHVTYEFELDGNIIKPGDNVRLRGDNRTLYKFRFIATNIKINSTWVELCGPNGYRAVREEALKALKVVKKRSRRHKPNE